MEETKALGVYRDVMHLLSDFPETKGMSMVEAAQFFLAEARKEEIELEGDLAHEFEEAKGLPFCTCSKHIKGTRFEKLERAELVYLKMLQTIKEVLSELKGKRKIDGFAIASSFDDGSSVEVLGRSVFSDLNALEQAVGTVCVDALLDMAEDIEDEGDRMNIIIASIAKAKRGTRWKKTTAMKKLDSALSGMKAGGAKLFEFPLGGGRGAPPKELLDLLMKIEQKRQETEDEERRREDEG